MTSATMFSVEAIRIVSLPRELESTDDVSQFIALTLSLTTTSVTIVKMQTNEGVHYRSAFADIAYDSSIGIDPTWMQNFETGGTVVQGEYFPGGIHFDNGKPMKHVKIVPSKKQAPSTEPLQLSDDDWTSIYIPVLPVDLTMDNGDMRYNEEDSLRWFFQNQLKIGEVSRVDFASKIVPGTDRTTRCAYVHFANWFDNRTTQVVRKTIAEKGEFSCNGYYDGFEFCRFERGRYITFKVNHKPIPAATEDMNVHQLAAAKEFLDKKVSDLDLQVEDLKAQNDALQLNVEALNEDISQQGTLQSAFEKLRLTMDALKLESETNPDFEGVDFNYVEALKELYEEYVPITLR